MVCVCIFRYKTWQQVILHSSPSLSNEIYHPPLNPPLVSPYQLNSLVSFLEAACNLTFVLMSPLLFFLIWLYVHVTLNSILFTSLRFEFYGITLILSALLKHNSLAIQFTDLKCTIQWCLAYPQSCTNVMRVNFRTFSSSREVRTWSLPTSPSPLSPPLPWAITGLLSVC